eukprot:12887367-Prorocentrum_lima.AAC.1
MQGKRGEGGRGKGEGEAIGGEREREREREEGAQEPAATLLRGTAAPLSRHATGTHADRSTSPWPRGGMI